MFFIADFVWPVVAVFYLNLNRYGSIPNVFLVTVVTRNLVDHSTLNLYYFGGTPKNIVSYPYGHLQKFDKLKENPNNNGLEI